MRSFSFSFHSLVSFSLDLTLFPLLHRTHIASLRFVALNFLRWLDDDVASLGLASSRWKHQVCLPTSNRHVSTDLRVQPTVRITYLRPAVPLLLFLLLSFSFPLVLSLFPSSAFARAIHAPRYGTTYLADLERAARNRCLQLPPRNILLKDCSLRTQTIRMLPRPAITVPAWTRTTFDSPHYWFVPGFLCVAGRFNGLRSCVHLGFGVTVPLVGNRRIWIPWRSAFSGLVSFTVASLKKFVDEIESRIFIFGNFFDQLVPLSHMYNIND